MSYNYNQGFQNPQMPQNQNPQMMQGQNAQMMQNVQPLFPQPQGNVYNINSTLEIANVPVGAGMSIGLCMPEKTMFIKTMQNGTPMFYPYRILPYENDPEPQKTEQKQNTDEYKELSKQIVSCTERIENLEQLLKQKKEVQFDI